MQVSVNVAGHKKVYLFDLWQNLQQLGVETAARVAPRRAKGIYGRRLEDAVQGWTGPTKGFMLRGDVARIEPVVGLVPRPISGDCVNINTATRHYLLELYCQACEHTRTLANIYILGLTFFSGNCKVSVLGSSGRRNTDCRVSCGESVVVGWFAVLC